MINKIKYCILGFLLPVLVWAQPFASEIAAFNKLDSISFPAAGQILLIGSSSFTKWKDVQNYFPGYPILNRGFGGSSLPDVIYYANDLIFPYRPKQIIIYCGENDFAASDTVSVKMVVDRFKNLLNVIRAKYKKIPVAYISMKPSPSRVQLMPEFVAANDHIKQYLKSKRNTAYIDVYSAMLDADGKAMADLFIEDNLHMNAKGYSIWQRIMTPFLKK